MNYTRIYSGFLDIYAIKKFINECALQQTYVAHRYCLRRVYDLGDLQF